MIQFYRFELKWGPENLYTFTIWPAIENVYVFSGPHFIMKEYNSTYPPYLMAMFILHSPNWVGELIKGAQIPTKKVVCC